MLFLHGFQADREPAMTRIRWKDKGRNLASLSICALVVVAGTVLYPLILLFFSLVALLYHLFHRPTRPGAAESQRGASR